MKILAIRIGRVGDIVMITPALRAILEKHPDADVHVLTSPDGRRVLKDFSPQVSKLIVHDRKSLLAFYHVKKIEEALHAEHYDKVFCFELNPRFSDLSKRLTDNNFCIDYSNESAHYSRRCLDTVTRAVDDELKDYWITLPVHDDARAKARAILADEGITDETFVVGLHPTYSGLKKVAWRRTNNAGRLWPAESFAELAKLIAAYGRERGLDIRIIMDLMPDEVETGEKIVQMSDGAVVMLVPPLDFERYKATLERMNVLVVSNTGPMHLGGAVGTHVVAFFGDVPPSDSAAYVAEGQNVNLMAPTKVVADITPQQAFEACKGFFPE